MSNVLMIDANVIDIGLKKRTERSGPELDMVYEFIDTTTKVFKHRNNKLAVFLEPLVETAYPDIVFAEYDPRLLESWSSLRNRLETVDLKIFESLRFMRGGPASSLIEKTNFSYKTTLLSIERLFDAGMIERKNGQWKPKPLREIYSLKRLTSVEAKMGEWGTLLNQADANKWFASESYALSPVKKPKDETVRRFQDLGIGLYSFNGGEIVEVNKAQKQKLPTSYMSWMFNEWVGRYATQS